MLLYEPRSSSPCRHCLLCIYASLRFLYTSTSHISSIGHPPQGAAACFHHRQVLVGNTGMKVCSSIRLKDTGSEASSLMNSPEGLAWCVYPRRKVHTHSRTSKRENADSLQPKAHPGRARRAVRHALESAVPRLAALDHCPQGRCALDGTVGSITAALTWSETGRWLSTASGPLPGHGSFPSDSHLCLFMVLGFQVPRVVH